MKISEYIFVKKNKSSIVCFISLFFLLLISCSNDFEQSYKTFNDFNDSGTRLKSWFPSDLITNNCYDFKEIHSLENSNSFGKFSYSNSSVIDSVLLYNKNYKEITIDSFSIILNKIIKPKKPSWFLSKEQIIGKKIYRLNTKGIIKDEKNKAIYFIYTSII